MASINLTQWRAKEARNKDVLLVQFRTGTADLCPDPRAVRDAERSGSSPSRNRGERPTEVSALLYTQSQSDFSK